MSYELIQANANNLPLENDSVDLVITSPPYFALRSYRDDGEHYDGQIGSEPTPSDFLDALIACTAEMKRVLKPTGSMFINLGDKYAGTGGANDNTGLGFDPSTDTEVDRFSSSRNNTKQTSGYVPRKSLMGLPWRYAIRCIDELHLILRQEIIWNKPNGLPESVTDRTRRNHEQWFHMTKEPRYYSSIDHIREPHTRSLRPSEANEKWSEMARQRSEASVAGFVRDDGEPKHFHSLGRLPGSVWTIPTEPLTGIPPHLPQHYAAFPQEWPRKLILGWSPTGICDECGQGRRPVVDIDWDKVPHTLIEKRVLTDQQKAEWCSAFAKWCDTQNIKRKDLATATGTSTMSGHWISRNGIQAEIPTSYQWSLIQQAFNPPNTFDELVHTTQLVKVAEWDTPDAETAGRHKTTKGAVLQKGDYTTITGEECDCPTPTAPTTPAVILDPFAGTGTVPGVAHTLGRHGIGTDLSHDYLQLAQWRIAESGHFEKSYKKSAAEGNNLPLTPPPTPTQGQTSLL